MKFLKTAETLLWVLVVGILYVPVTVLLGLADIIVRRIESLRKQGGLDVFFG